MLTINREYNHISILLSNPGTGTRGFRVKAKNIEEVHNAISHYFCEKTHQDLTTKDCPLCRYEAKH